jgi:outer membrane receptor for ferric coprogen and ferric-rhodotorulic acid
MSWPIALKHGPWSMYGLVALWMLCGSGEWAIAQEAGRPAGQPAASEEAQIVREVGGRLVASGETVLVKGELDQMPRESSIATKIETPLLATPRSITIIDRRTLDDMAVINITQAHDYTVGMTPQDERGPAFARGFPVDFYDLRRDG